MAATRVPAKRVIQQVRPILSLDRDEARRRVFNLYKAWYRTAPFVGKFIFWTSDSLTNIRQYAIFEWHNRLLKSVS